jgi:RHS repeat-associated protein
MRLESGNLIYDFGENISNIVWSADGKVLSVVKTNNDRLDFLYDAKGERVRKLTFDAVTVTNKNTYYIRDANGEVLAIYEGESTDANPRYNVMFSEWLIYGSKSHGRFARTKEPNPSPNLMMYDPTVLYNPVLLTGGPPTHTRKLSFKDYELKDHLGDVRLVFSDLKLRPAYGENDFRLDQREASNYYPFGMIMPGLHWNTTSFSSRFAFNGMMKDDGIKGLGNSYNTEFRMFDPRIGRWLSKDPVAKPWESTYAGMGNNPIGMIDPLGDDAYVQSQTGSTCSDDKNDYFYYALKYWREATQDKIDFFEVSPGTIKIEILEEAKNPDVTTQALRMVIKDPSFVLYSQEIVQNPMEINNYSAESQTIIFPWVENKLKKGESVTTDIPIVINPFISESYMVEDMCSKKGMKIQKIDIPSKIIHEFWHFLSCSGCDIVDGYLVQRKSNWYFEEDPQGKGKIKLKSTYYPDPDNGNKTILHKSEVKVMRNERKFQEDRHYPNLRKLPNEKNKKKR